MAKIHIKGIPNDIDETKVAVYRSRVITATDKFMSDLNLESISVSISTEENVTNAKTDKGSQSASGLDMSVEERAEQYECVAPYWELSQLIVSEDLINELHTAIDSITLEPLVFDTWGLRKIEPFNRSALNFHGPPGTGKTLAAHGVASQLKKNILIASYAQIESKYHGDGPKNVEAIFFAAQRDNAVLFIDEADSLLSKRLTNVTQGSEQAINSMRSQLLICLEKYKGIVIFATNLVGNYDAAFETRVRNVHFTMPDKKSRIAIWRKHIPDKLPVSEDLDIDQLAELYEGFCGRDIKNTIIDAAFQAARLGMQIINNDILTKSASKLLCTKAALISNDQSSESDNSKATSIMKSKLRDKLNDLKAENN